MTDNVINMDDHRIASYLTEAIDLFLSDPPDNPYQIGYLAALINVYREGLGRGKSDARLIAAEQLTVVVR